MATAAVLDRLQAAQNAHDLDAMVDCFHSDHSSEQPRHPRHPHRSFRGAEQVRRNWAALFEESRELTVELLSHAEGHDGATLWSEWRWTGAPDGSGFEVVGVIILGVHDGRILWARLYMDEIERPSQPMDDATDHPNGGSTGAG